MDPPQLSRTEATLISPFYRHKPEAQGGEGSSPRLQTGKHWFQDLNSDSWVLEASLHSGPPLLPETHVISLSACEESPENAPEHLGEG